MTGTVEILPHKSGGYLWHLRGANGEIVATSGSESFENPTDARAAAERALEIGRDDPAFKTVYRFKEEPPEAA